MASQDPVTPDRPTNVPEIMISAPTPAAALPTPVVVITPTLTRSVTNFDMTALAKDSPDPSNDDIAGPSSSGPPTPTAPEPAPTEALADVPTTDEHLSLSFKPTYIDRSPIRMHILSDFVASRNPFNLKVRNENTGKEKPDITPNEIRILAQCYGESMVWTMRIEDICCQRCIERARKKNEREYRTYVYEFLDKNADILQAYLRLRGVHNPGPCSHDNGSHLQISHLMSQVGDQDSTRIKSILLTSTHRNTFQNADKVASAIGIIIQSFPNIQKATIKLHSEPFSLSESSDLDPESCEPAPDSDEGQKSLIADGVAVKLARAFALLEKQLPEEEGLVVMGLERQPVLGERWRVVKRRWWDRRAAFGRKVLG
ncbi:hypothetical protein BKA64DRAFT_716783 [Cadophora sp. MPI-SDFR-AT-0126]|nr:hypothetical protein BKA64DRAFT_716783 [Leotiomycetes sp. MPI-SDFR-AT-0126]